MLACYEPAGFISPSLTADMIKRTIEISREPAHLAVSS